MKITCMMRIKNEARWLREVLASVLQVTPDILIFDDHSTDDSRAIAAQMGAVVLRSPFAPEDTDESRDKNMLLEAVRLHEADWVLSIDGDEVLERGAAERIQKKLLPGICVLSFPVRYIWNDREHYRADGVYAKFTRASMFQLQPGVQFQGTHYGANFHCGNIPMGLKGSGATVAVDILHLGYMHAEDRIRKFHWYNQKDPGNQYEDGYKHIVLGDLPEYPASMKRLHGGPLKLFTLPASKWPEVSVIA